MNTQTNLMNILCLVNARMNLMNIHDVYNFSLTNHNKISKKENFFVLKQTLRMQNKSVIINNFNLHHLI